MCFTEILVGATGYADASTRNARVGGVFLNPNPGGNPTLLVTGKQVCTYVCACVYCGGLMCNAVDSSAN